MLVIAPVQQRNQRTGIDENIGVRDLTHGRTLPCVSGSC